jgi:hypothetical protein
MLVCRLSLIESEQKKGCDVRTSEGTSRFMGSQGRKTCSSKRLSRGFSGGSRRATSPTLRTGKSGIATRLRPLQSSLLPCHADLDDETLDRTRSLLAQPWQNSASKRELAPVTRVISKRVIYRVDQLLALRPSRSFMIWRTVCREATRNIRSVCVCVSTTLPVIR